MKRIVVGLDDSQPARRALTWAADRADRKGVPLKVVSVIEDDSGSMGQEFHELERLATARLLSDAVAATAVAHPRLVIEETMLEGGLAWSLAASSTNRDLLVIGTHKTGYVHGRVLGSRGVQIALTAQSSVAVIPDLEMKFRHGVVAGIDREETAELIGRAAAEEAADRDQELVLVRAVPLRGRSSDAARSDLVLAAARHAAQRVDPMLQITTRVSHRVPAEALLDIARDQTLLVLGPGSAEPTRSRVGSVLLEVLLNVDVPTLVVRDGYQLEGVGDAPIAATTGTTQTGIGESASRS